MLNGNVGTCVWVGSTINTSLFNLNLVSNPVAVAVEKCTVFSYIHTILCN